MIKRCIITFTTFLLCQNSFASDEDVLWGKLVSRSHKTNVSNLVVFIKQSGFQNYYTKTDTKGNFELGFSHNRSGGQMAFYYITHKNDTVLIKTINHFSKKQTRMDTVGDQAFTYTFYIP